MGNSAGRSGPKEADHIALMKELSTLHGEVFDHLHRSFRGIEPASIARLEAQYEARVGTACAARLVHLLKTRCASELTFESYHAFASSIRGSRHLPVPPSRHLVAPRCLYRVCTAFVVLVTTYRFLARSQFGGSRWNT